MKTAQESHHTLATGTKSAINSLSAEVKTLASGLDSIREGFKELEDERKRQREESYRQLEAKLETTKGEVASLKETLSAVEDEVTATTALLKCSVDQSEKKAPEHKGGASAIQVLNKAHLMKAHATAFVQQSCAFASVICQLVGRTSENPPPYPRTAGDASSVPTLWAKGAEDTSAVVKLLNETLGDRDRFREEVRVTRFVVQKINQGVYAPQEWKEAMQTEDTSQLSENDPNGSTSLVDVARTLENVTKKYTELEMRNRPPPGRPRAHFPLGPYFN